MRMPPLTVGCAGSAVDRAVASDSCWPHPRPHVLAVNSDLLREKPASRLRMQPAGRLQGAAASLHLF
jgi:hypothetical protein